MSRLKFFYTIVIKLILGPIKALQYNVTGDKIVVPEGPNLIISNHVTNIDYMLIGHKLTCRQAHYVMAENAARNPFVRKALDFLDEPIVHFKGSNALSTVREMHKRFKRGDNVMLFPEGNTSFDGATTRQDESVGKLAKLSGANLVLTRIEGGYLSRPRWSVGRRKGKITVIGKVITSDDVRKMSVAELTEAINEHIFTDAYEEQSNEKVAFKGRDLATGLERAMYLCPECHNVGNLVSSRNHISCKCGYKAEFDEYGYLNDENGKVYSVKDALSEQKDWLNSQRGFLFSDQVMITDMTTDSPMELGRYRINTYSDHLHFENTDNESKSWESDISDINNATIFKANTLTLFINKNGETNIYEMEGGFSFNALKYRDLMEMTNSL